MNVQDTIKMLEETLSELKELDPDMEVVGHVIYPADGYSGDLSGEITSLSVEVGDTFGDGNDSVVIGVNHQ